MKVELDYARQVIPAAERFMRSFKTAGGDEQKYNKVCEEQIKMACEDGVKRFVKPWAEREMRTQLKEEALKRASLDFAANVKALLLQPPLRPQGTVLALDPGYRAGCKCAVVDKMGNVLETFVCYLHKEMEMKKKIKNVCEQYKVSVIAIGDGTASRETETLVANSNLNIIVDDDDDDKKNDSKNSCLRGWVVTSEAGASIYSASEIATKELPNLDVSLRGAVSIARRVQDPLAELVKLDPKHVGVGMYQHDAKSGALDKELDYVVESARRVRRRGFKHRVDIAPFQSTWNDKKRRQKHRRRTRKARSSVLLQNRRENSQRLRREDVRANRRFLESRGK